MKVGARARLTLVVMIGVVAGLGFISLPSILAVPSAPSTTSPPSPTTRSGTNSTSGTTTSYSGSVSTLSVNTTSAKFTNGTKTQVPALTTITPDALTALITLIVVPALALSWVTAVLVSSRARKVLEDIPESESSQENSDGP